jgi:hypothetical protein
VRWIRYGLNGGLVWIGLIWLLSGCAFTFIPLIPEPIRLEPRLLVGSNSALERQGAEIVLRLELTRVPNEGYVSLYLYRGDDKIGEDSKLARLDTRSLEFRFSPAVIGRYRAVVFWASSVVRQFDLEVR